MTTTPVAAEGPELVTTSSKSGGSPTRAAEASWLLAIATSASEPNTTSAVSCGEVRGPRASVQVTTAGFVSVCAPVRPRVGSVEATIVSVEEDTPTPSVSPFVQRTGWGAVSATTSATQLQSVPLEEA